jgi:alternate signal-mediated exported protein
MKKTTKGALAATAAGVLLMGGAGTLAYWTDSVDVPGGTVASGSLDLGNPACGVGWTLDGGTPYVAQQLVPGDTLTKVCTIDLVAQGEHIGADLTVATPTWTAANGLTAELTPSATFLVNGVATSHVTETDDINGSEIEATLTVVFDGPAATNASQSLSATLNAVTVAATQTHDG